MGEEEAPVLSAAVCVCDCVSVLTQSKSICHQGCHCGTKREGSLPGRTHSERNGERQRQATRRRGGVEEKARPKGQGAGQPVAPPPPFTCCYNSKRTCRDQEDETLKFPHQLARLAGIGWTAAAPCGASFWLLRSAEQKSEMPPPPHLFVDVDEEIKSSPRVGLMLC